MRTHPKIHARYGGGLAHCFGAVRQNIVKANGTGAAVDEQSSEPAETTLGGGGFYVCMDVRRNFIYGNTADLGGGIFAVAYFTEGSTTHWGTVQGNIIAENSASTQGGGVFAPRGRIENNTIYGNESDGIAGVYLEAGLLSASTDDLIFQNNIVWENDDGTADSTPFPANEVSQALIDLDVITYCAVQHNAAPGNATGNVGPWSGSGVTNLGLISTTLNANFDHDNDGGAETPTIYNYHEYLHIAPIGSTSPLIDKGQPERSKYSASDFERPNREGSFIGRDADNQLRVLDITTPAIGNSDPGEEEQPVVRDIGADEYPTGIDGFIYWWEAVGVLE